MNQQLPKEIQVWLNKRSISDETIETYEISFAANKIVIPVKDRSGEFLFNKYRQNPFEPTGPKYSYDKGSKSTLFGLNHIDDVSPIFITEGELDAICLASKGYNAVSSTGGAGTFDPEWGKFFEGKDIYIVYDHDDAGIKGAFHTQSIIPWAKIIWLPKQVGEHGDVTDYFVKLKKTKEHFDKLVLESKTWELPDDWKYNENYKLSKHHLKSHEAKYREKADMLMLVARELRDKNEGEKHVQELIMMYLDKIAEVKRAIKYFDKPKGLLGNDKIAAAKRVPIPMFIKFGPDGFAKCIFHTDKKPSMYWYAKQNRVKCFSCGKLADVIDVIQELRKVNLPEALKIILNE